VAGRRARRLARTCWMRACSRRALSLRVFRGGCGAKVFDAGVFAPGFVAWGLSSGVWRGGVRCERVCAGLCRLGPPVGEPGAKVFDASRFAPGLSLWVFRRGVWRESVRREQVRVRLCRLGSFAGEPGAKVFDASRFAPGFGTCGIPRGPHGVWRVVRGGSASNSPNRWQICVRAAWASEKRSAWREDARSEHVHASPANRPSPALRPPTTPSLSDAVRQRPARPPPPAAARRASASPAPGR
jgi:hypothetical protein